MSIVRAMVIINAAKKGWSEAARKKAAMSRKRKSKPEVKKPGEANPAWTAKLGNAMSRVHKSSDSFKSTAKKLGLSLKKSFVRKDGSHTLWAIGQGRIYGSYRVMPEEAAKAKKKAKK